jgi:predicted nicotinamide N-methyase
MVERGPWDIVLAADVLYEARNVAVLEELLPRLVGDSGEVWLADPGRAAGEDFFARAAERWSVRTTHDPAPPHVSVWRLRPLQK